MTDSTLNSSSSPSGYYWNECDPYHDESASAGFLILLTTHSLEFLTSAPSNLWLICHILRKRSKGSGVLPTDFFPLNLALAQFAYHLTVPVFLANHFLWRNDYLSYVIPVMTGMVLGLKPSLLCMVCVERYMAVVRPLDYLRFKTGNYRWGCLGASWCIYILMPAAILFDPSGNAVCVFFLTVLVIGTFCSVCILRTLKRSPPGDRDMAEGNKGAEKRKAEKQEKSREKEEKEREFGRKSDPSGKGIMTSQKQKAFTTVVTIQAVLMLNYLPFVICLPMYEVVPARTLKCQYRAMALAAAASCSYLQPLLYLHRLGRLPFKKSLPA